MLMVKCPKCLHDQLYDPRISERCPTVVGKKKSCVYCGLSFAVHTNQVKSRIVNIA